MLILAEPLRLRPSPIRALRAAEEDIATYPPSTHNHKVCKIEKHQPLPAMSSPVSPRQRDIGEVASLRAEGVAPTAAKRLFCEVESRKVFNAAMLILTEPLRLRHFTYPRSARQRRTLLRIHLQQRTTTYLPASPTYQPTPLNSQP